MSLSETVDQDFQAALKNKDEAVISTLRLLKSELIKKAKEGKEVTGEMELQVLKSQIKQRRESIVEYQKGGREDLVNQEQAELTILEKYLPPQLSEEAVRALVVEALQDLTESDKANFGKVMGAVMAKVGKAADGGLVNKIVKEQLG